MVRGRWQDLATVVSSARPLCPSDCQTGGLHQDWGEAGLGLTEDVIYISDKSHLPNVSQLCLQGMEDITLVLEDELDTEDDTEECERWCSR